MSEAETGGLVRANERMNATKYRDVKNVYMRVQRTFTFQHNNDLKRRAKTILEWLQAKSLTVQECPSQSPDLNSTEHLRRDLKIAVHRCLPSNLTELETIYQEEGDKLP